MLTYITLKGERCLIFPVVMGRCVRRGKWCHGVWPFWMKGEGHGDDVDHLPMPFAITASPCYSRSMAPSVDWEKSTSNSSPSTMKRYFFASTYFTFVVELKMQMQSQKLMPCSSV